MATKPAKRKPAKRKPAKKIKGSRAAPRKAAARPKGTGPVMADGLEVHCAHDELVDPHRLVQHKRNPNAHPDTQIALLAKLITAHGWRAPITVSTRSGFVVRGHGRLQAALLMEVTAVPVDYQEYENEAMEWADCLADNKIAELSELDRGMTRSIIEELDTGAFDLDLTGFDYDSLEELMTAAPPPDFSPTDGEKQPRLDQKKPVKCPECGHEWERK